MKQLIEDLISAMEYHVEQTRPVHMTTVAIQAAKDALKAMSEAQPAPVQEHVAYLFTNVQSGDIEASTDPDHKEGEREIWHRELLARAINPPAAQRQWVGLTDEDVEECVKRCRSADGLARAIEAKLKEKNT